MLLSILNCALCFCLPMKRVVCNMHKPMSSDLRSKPSEYVHLFHSIVQSDDAQKAKMRDSSIVRRFVHANNHN